MRDDVDAADAANIPLRSLFGRDREQARLRDAFNAMLHGHGRLVLLGGEAGIGKSTLVGWLTEIAAHHGASILAGGCYDLTATPPYGPWLEMTDRYPAGPGVPAVPQVLRRGSEVAPPSEEQHVLFGALRHNQEQTNRLFGAIVGTVPIQEFFAPENLGRIISGAVADAAATS